MIVVQKAWGSKSIPVSKPSTFSDTHAKRGRCIGTESAQSSRYGLVRSASEISCAAERSIDATFSKPNFILTVSRNSATSTPQIFQSTLVLFDPCLIRVFFSKKIEVFFFENRGLFFTYYIYKNFLGTPCLCQLHGGRKGGSNQQCACEELQLDCIFSEGSAEVYEQPCACQLPFFLKPVQKCMNNFVHVHQQTCVAQNNFLQNARPGRNDRGSRQSFDSSLPSRWSCNYNLPASRSWANHREAGTCHPRFGDAQGSAKN